MPTVRRAVLMTVAVASLAASSCGRDEGGRNESANAANTAAEQEAVPKHPIPVPEPPLDRAQLLLAATRAASDFAAAADDRERQKKLADRKFEFRIRFGCEGPGDEGRDRPFNWTYNEKTGALKVRAALTLSLEDAPVEAIAGGAFESVEGAWVRRPWLLTAACPLRDAADAPRSNSGRAEALKPAAAGEAGTRTVIDRTVGIAQFFTATGPRTMRRSGRPYEATKRLDAEKDRPVGGFDLVLGGRLTPLPNGRVIACTRSQAGERPSCIISVEFGKVAIERADTHEQLAQWGSG